MTMPGLLLQMVCHWFGCCATLDIGRLIASAAQTLMGALLDHGLQRGYKHLFYGATIVTLHRLVEEISRRYPTLASSDRMRPLIRASGVEEERSVIDSINMTKVDFVWVGLGAPKQELRMALHRSRLDAPVLLGLGAAFGGHVRNVRQAPSFLRRGGLECAYRMAMKPRRLGKRYLRKNPAFIGLVLARKVGLRDFDSPNQSRF